VPSYYLDCSGACFENTIGVEGERLALLPAKDQLVVDCILAERERQRASHRKLVAVSEGRQVSGIGQHRHTAGGEVQQWAGGEAAFAAADEPGIQATQNLRRLPGIFSDATMSSCRPKRQATSTTCPTDVTCPPAQLVDSKP
jgi:hypothetical protein